jgi:hypothetical protein
MKARGAYEAEAVCLETLGSGTPVFGSRNRPNGSGSLVSVQNPHADHLLDLGLDLPRHESWVSEERRDHAKAVGPEAFDDVEGVAEVLLVHRSWAPGTLSG